MPLRPRSRAQPQPAPRLRPRRWVRATEAGAVTPDSESSLISCSATFTSSMCWKRRSRIFAQAPQNDFSRSLWIAGTTALRRLRLRAEHGAQRVGRGRPGKRARPRHHLVEHRAEAEDVAPRIHRPAGGLLRRHVGGGARQSSPARSAPHPLCASVPRPPRPCRRLHSAWPGRSRAPSPRRPRRPSRWPV